MMAGCEVIPTPESLAPGLIGALDCHAQTIGARGYAVLSAGGSPVITILSVALALVIALIGYNLLLGRAPSLRDGVMTFIKIGIVLSLATSWPAYQTLIYDVMLHAPAELASAVGDASGLPGPSGGLVNRLDNADQALSALARMGVGAPPRDVAGNFVVPQIAPSPFLNFDAFALGFARLGFLVSTIASFAVVRLIAGVLLTLGPLFAGFLLFDGTRGLFEGWLKVLVGSAIASFALSIVLGIELAILEPWLTQLIARRAADLDVIGAPVELLATATIFGLGLVATLALSFRVASSLRLPAWGILAGQRDRADLTIERAAVTGRSLVPVHSPHEARSRAAIIADAVAVSQTRSGASTSSPTTLLPQPAMTRMARPAAEAMPIYADRAQARRARRRVSAGARARDGRR